MISVRTTKNVNYAILLVAFLTLGFRHGIAQSTNTPLIATNTSKAINVKIFDALWEKVNSKYYDPAFNGVDWKAVKEKYRPRAENAVNKQTLLMVLRQMVSELKTSHVYVWQTVSKRKLEQKIKGDFDRKRDSLYIGYGFGVKPVEGDVVVTRLERDSKAETSGVQIGWILDEIDGVPAKRSMGITADFSEGATARFKFIDPDGQRHEMTLTAELWVSKQVRHARLLAENTKVLYLKVGGFQLGTADWIRKELGRTNQKTAVIIDLRENGGGYVDEVKSSVGSFFADDLEFGTFVERTGKQKIQRIKGRRSDAFLGNLAVLVDRYSASGAEIFAQLIRENRRGTLVGEVTSGQVLNGIDFDLPEDFKASIAFRDYVSPNDFRIEGKGVAPDVIVPVTIQEIRASRDSALERAIEIVSNASSLNSNGVFLK